MEQDADDTHCKHGTAWDVHCCNCHSGFLFDVMDCTCVFSFEQLMAWHVKPRQPWWSRLLCWLGLHDWRNGPGTRCTVCGKEDELWQNNR